MSRYALLAAVALLPVALAVVVAVLRRPQRGVLLLAALVPFDGLLLVVPLPAPVDAWKEGLLLLVLLGALLSRPPAARGRAPWAPALLALLVLTLGAALVGVVDGRALGVAVALKVGWTWVLLVPVLLRCPLDAVERDRLVTVLMTAGGVTAVYGLAQQAVGAEGLAALGYEFDTAIRTSGGVLRSFSTFAQPFPFGLFLMLVLLLGLPVSLSEPRRPRSLLFLGVAPVLVAGVLSSIVRAAVLGLVVGLLFLWAHRYRALGVLALPLALALSVAAAVVPPRLWTPLLSSSSLQQRGTGWSGVLDDVLSAPLGNGLGTTGAAAELTARLEGSDVPTLQTDNHYLKVLYELGPLGLWLFLLVLVGALLHARWVSARTEAADAALAAGTGAAVLAAMAASSVATYFEIFPLDVYFWLLLGVLSSLPLHASSSRPSPSDRAAAASRPTAASSSAR